MSKVYNKYSYHHHPSDLPMQIRPPSKATIQSERSTRSQTRKCESDKTKGSKINEISSKSTETLVNPRIARRVKMISQVSKATTEKCAICLSSSEESFGSLECGHEFCMPCLVKWWRHHSTCPCCREEILFIINQGKIILFQDLPPEEIDENQPFVAHCELCWGDIEPHEEMNICTVCRSVYWHSRCLPYKSKRWYCAECAEEDEDEESNQE